MKHVQQRNGRFVWRLNLFDEVMRNLNENDVEVTYSHPALAAYDCDLVKYFLREKYNLRSSKTEPSFPPEQFQERAERAGLDLSDLPAVFSAMPESAQEFLSNYGDVLKAHADRVSSRPPPSTDYLAILLAALSSRLTAAKSVLHKARQLNALNSNQRAAIQELENKVEAFEISSREETARILTLV